ncbi:tetratricopeptide repeat protein [Sphingomicrobium marinum]|uniref:tetratricopeptide repeat protein n=1 Tax=Sphingomicrobium marinum TaxID=1227950 RepID=UPI00223F7B2B|nr:tetratricopeptide repeat protein [Sphingomicrobium marinum]
MTIRNAKHIAGAIVLTAGLSACATPGPNASIFGSKVAHDEIGLATRAQAALVQGEVETAIHYAEKAVAGSPNDAGFRTLLGNAYFAAGRFASADQAYADSLSIMPAQPQTILKRSLVMIAQGRGDAAVSLLDTARGYVSESDRGLALALAGRHQSAISVLDNAARSASGDARTRQNLALAYALSGDWNNARAIAAQDVPADQLDARLTQWRVMATPTHQSQQVAALTGVTPAQIDPGQPTRLALAPQADAGTQMAAVTLPPVAPQVGPVISTPLRVEQSVEKFEVANVETNREFAERPAANVRVTDIPVIDGEFQEIEEVAPQPVEAAPAPSIMTPADIAAMPVKFAEAKTAPSAGLSSDATRFTQSAASITAAAEALKGESKIVVQLGAYSKRSQLDMGWEVSTANFAPIGDFKPMAARTEVGGKKYYRLAAWGFAGDAEARDFCMSIKQAGGECWVREVAGDAPFKLASR